MTTKTRVPAIDGWFTTDEDQPALLGSRCTGCRTYAFPAERFVCRNPSCGSRTFDEVELSRRGTIWSYTNACYQPPPPYVPVTDPFEPFALVAVSLAEEAMVVMGQVVEGVGVEQLAVGQEVELVLGTLFEDDEHEYLIWRWRPIGDANDGAEVAR